MKVNIYETVEVDDADRVKIANIIDGNTDRKKPGATRDELKEFIWQHGLAWPSVAESKWNEKFGERQPAFSPPESDFI